MASIHSNQSTLQETDETVALKAEAWPINLLQYFDIDDFSNILVVKQPIPQGSTDYIDYLTPQHFETLAPGQAAFRGKDELGRFYVTFLISVPPPFGKSKPGCWEGSLEIFTIFKRYVYSEDIVGAGTHLSLSVQDSFYSINKTISIDRWKNHILFLKKLLSNPTGDLKLVLYPLDKNGNSVSESTPEDMKVYCSMGRHSLEELKKNPTESKKSPSPR